MSEQAAALVTAADISRLAGVTRATVSNWRRRHPDFPAPVGGTDSSPAYDLDAVRDWLSARGQLPEGSPGEELRIVLRARPDSGRVASSLFPVVLAAAGLRREELNGLLDLPDEDLMRWSRSATSTLAEDVPGVAETVGDSVGPGLLRAVLRHVLAEGAEAAADVLAERLLEDSGASGTYVTPTQLTDLMTGLLVDEPGAFPKSVLDPACGSGSLLAAAARAGATELYGQDILTGQAVQAAVRLHLAARSADITVRAGDSLRSDAFPGLVVDAVLCNPPYGDRGWGHDELAYDERWAYGLPPKSEPELAWVQHCLSHLASGARAVLLMPPAVAERAAGRRIRSQLVRDGALRAVIALPQGAAAPLHIGLHLWILERPGRSSDAPESVLFIDAATSHAPASTKQALDWDALTTTVLATWRAYRESEDFTAIPATARAVPVVDLLDQAVDLTPLRHVPAAHTAADPVQLARQAVELHNRLRQAATDLGDLSRNDGWQPAGERPRGWRTATVADLLRGGALELLHTLPSRRTRAGELESSSTLESGGRPVLTVQDVVEGRAASGVPTDLTTGGTTHPLRQGDVVLPEIVRSESPTVARVVEADDADCVLGPHLWLFRPDPQRLDPWFLAGFLAAEENVNAATTGTSIVRVDPRRLRVPLLPLAEQRRYGAAFRHLHALRTSARRAAQTAEEVSRVLSAGLTGGALLPPGHESP